MSSNRNKWLNRGYPVEVDGKIVREYRVWYGINNRVVSLDNYKGVTVCDEWKDYGNFYEWVVQQKGWYSKDIHGKSFSVDKDIKSFISGEPKMYSPETCIIIPNSINNYFHLNKNTNINRQLPFGVMKSKKYPNKFNTVIDYHNKSRKKDTVEEAQELYLIQKKEGLLNLVEMYKEDLEDETVELLRGFDFYKYFKDNGCNIVV